METIHILTISLTGQTPNILAASTDKGFLREEMKRHINDYLNNPENYPDEDATARKRREELRKAMDAADDHWDDGEEGYLLAYDIEEVRVLLPPGKPLPPPTARQAVAEQVIAMLSNNILQDYGPEPFAGWCEDGAVFDGYADMPKDTKDDCTFLMNEVAPHVDKITEKLTEPLND